MYLTAQHVRRQNGEEGINTFGYSHEHSPAPGIDWRSPDVVRVADEHPGKLMFASRKVTTPGGSVLSFLDVAAADLMPAPSIAATLRAAAVAWRPELMQSMAVWSLGSVSFRLYLGPAVREHAAQEFRALNSELQLAVAGALTHEQGLPVLSVPPPQPLKIFRHRGAASDRYTLDPGSRTLLSAALPAGVVPPGAVNVTHVNREAFAHFMGGDLNEQAVLVLTGCSAAQLDALGGAVVLDEDTGEVLWRTPGA